MRVPHRFPAVLLPLLLAACTPALVRHQGDAGQLDAQLAREHAMAHTDHWTLEGRLGVSDGHDGGSGGFTWTQDGDNYRFVFRAPITGRSFELSGGGAGALLEGLDGGPLQGADAETLMRRALGWEVPLHDLRAWVLGLRADSGPAQLSFGDNQLPSQLRQDGWTVEYRAWDVTRQPPLPTTIFAAQPPYKVRLSVESWTIR